MSAAPAAQVAASDPAASVFVSANAGSGKTSTLVKRVARLLLAGARPEAILCVTFTKAGAAEMQRRLFKDLGDWAVMDDASLEAALAEIDEGAREFSKARALFARALETPGGLKIQTLHGFCERLLRRFPLEAGVSPGFTVLEDAAAAEISRNARDAVAAHAQAHPGGLVAEAYAYFSVQMDWRAFNAMFGAFEARRAAIGAYLARCEQVGGFAVDVWRQCGFPGPDSREAIEQDALSRMRWTFWTRAAEAVARGGGKTDATLAAAMRAVTPQTRFAEIWAIFSTQAGTPRVKLGTNGVDAAARAWLMEEQARHQRTQEQLVAAAVAEDTVAALALATTYAGAYEDAKAARGGLDFGDLVARAIHLLTVKADAAWVLFKLDGGLEHVLLDEAQDTAPEQWDILRELTAEFFTGEGVFSTPRTVFAVGDEKQSIFSFQGAAPERLGHESGVFGAKVKASGGRFLSLPLVDSWRSTPEILGFVDKVFAAPEILAGLRPASGETVRATPIAHRALREDHGCVDLWPLEQTDEREEPDWWTPLDQEPSEGANKKLARRIAREIKAMVARGDGVLDRQNKCARSCGHGDVLILVRRRNVLFHEIIRALKREGVPVGGADRLKLSEHAVFQDLIALASFACFPADDLTLAALLRGPFCDVNEVSLFDLAHGRDGSLWQALSARQGERPEWSSAVAFLRWVRQEAPRRAPFDIFNLILNRLDEAGRSMRQRILTRLGAEAQDALEAFLGQALAAEDQGVRDLESFIARMAATELEIKREPDQAQSAGGSQVRVMTAHGAKGLEAPIVILPDTTSRVTAQGGPLLETPEGGFLWAPRKADDCPASAEARASRDTGAEQEAARLLYVALTRARDRLIIAGVESKLFERSWRDYLQRAFDDLPIRPFALEDGAEAWRYGRDPASGADALAPSPVPAALPAWTLGLAPAEAAMVSQVSPSRLGDAEAGGGAAPSPLESVSGLGRYRRGDIIHRLLQLLPDIGPAERPAAARSLLTRERDLTDAQRAEMADAALTVLGDPRFAAVFGPGSRAEAALAGAAARLPADLAISGRVDRLVVEEERVLVVDFKTNRPAPHRIEDADPAYVLQMAVYAAVLAEIFPGRTIEAALVWTDGPKLMPVPEGMMQAALGNLAKA
jgi:ATP-dependent helicase/nuclease subunit A